MFVTTCHDITVQDDIPNYAFGTVTGCSLNQGIFVGFLDIYGISELLRSLIIRLQPPRSRNCDPRRYPSRLLWSHARHVQWRLLCSEYHRS